MRWWQRKLNGFIDQLFTDTIKGFKKYGTNKFVKGAGRTKKISEKVSLFIGKFILEERGIDSKTKLLKFQIEGKKMHFSICWKQLKK